MRFLSLFSGIEAASVAWKPLGWQCVAFAEIEPMPSAVLAHHYPDVPNLGDVTAVTEAQIADLGKIDAVVFGAPCQDLSVAGLRKGLKHADGTITRSGLFFTACRIAEWAKSRWTIYENVPGMFSSNEGRDFGSVVGELVGCEVDLFSDGWRNAGVALGPRGLVEWFTLDAQFVRVSSHPRAVPQRRRRVFVVRDSGDWRSRSPLFLERASLCGHPAPRRESRESVAGTISARTQGGGGLGTDFELSGGQTAIAGADSAKWAKGTGGPAGDECQNLLAVAHSLRADGFDASEDGSGRATPIVPIAFDETQITSRTNGSNPQCGDPCHTIGSESRPPTIAFPANLSGTQCASAEDVAPAMGAANPTAVAFDQRGREGGAQFEGPHDTANIRAASGGSSRSYVAQQWAVRRLTPRECERLQGFPDDYTAIKYGKHIAKDGPRYKAIGNSMAVNVMSWLGQRIAAVEGIQ